MSEVKRYWIYKGTSNFCEELIPDDNCENMVKQKPDGFYDIVSTKDTIEGGLHVIEYSYARELEEKLKAYISAVDKFNNLWLEHGCETNTRSCLLCQIHGLIHDSLDKTLSGETKEGV